MPSWLRDNARRDPERVGLREKEFGIWQETTYAEYWELVRTVGMALRAMGVVPGDKVAIQSENRLAWVVGDLAAQGIQAVSVGLYSTNPAAEVEYLLHHSDSKVLIAEDQEQVDKALAVRDRLPKLERIVYIEPRGVNAYDDPILISWSEFLELGSQHLAAAPDDFDRLVDAIDVEETATIVYTSGTTGPPKGAMLSHRNLVWTAGEAKSVIAGTGAMPDRAELLSYLPLCHVFGRLYDLCYAIATRSTVNFAESIDTVVADLQEIQPSYFPAPPRIWEKMSAGAQIRIAHASPLKRLVYGAALQAGMWNADRMLQRGGRGLLGSVVYGAGWLLAYRSLQKKMGMSKCRQAVSGAAPIAPDLLKFFMAVGVPIVEGWGMTETTAMGTVNQLGSVKLGTIGEPLPGCEIEIAADGEILTRHPAVFKGYFKNPAATDEAIDGDGWLHTGDVGEWDGNHVRIIDRKKDIIITAGGKNISPSELENRLKVSPFIKEAMVVGDSRKFISALIGIEFDVAANWAQRRDITFTTYRDLSEKPEIIRLIDKQVEEANADFARVEQIKRFKLIPKELDHDQGELTATQKIKRKVLVEQFSDLIEEMYS
ncbi:MAG: AMP-binding protein [Acidimicrobiia bacterium]|nr:AMP-binding protein [Acidimicrobiia bacterium]MDX2467256.1 AMP-binding protein [Acidimicrobiia bacterium]